MANYFLPLFYDYSISVFFYLEVEMGQKFFVFFFICKNSVPKRAIFIFFLVKFELLLLSGNVVLELLQAYNPFENLMKAGEPLL